MTNDSSSRVKFQCEKIWDDSQVWHHTALHSPRYTRCDHSLSAQRILKPPFTSEDFDFAFTKNAAAVFAPIPSRYVSPSALQMSFTMMARVMASEEQVINGYPGTEVVSHSWFFQLSVWVTGLDVVITESLRTKCIHLAKIAAGLTDHLHR